MSLRPLWNFQRWTDASLARMRMGRSLQRNPNDLLGMIGALAPRVENICVRVAGNAIVVSPSKGEPCGQESLGLLLDTCEAPGWRVSNLKRRLDPKLTVEIVGWFGLGALLVQNSWFRIVVPENLAIEFTSQKYRSGFEAFFSQVAARDGADWSVREFDRASVSAIGASLPVEEARNYFHQMR